MKHRILRTTIAGLILIPALSFAQTPGTSTPNLDQRQVNQQNRIAEGIKSGQLTAKEAENLEKREAKLEANKQMAKADGVVSKKERAKLQREANRDSRKIYQKKHNKKTAAHQPG